VISLLRLIAALNALSATLLCLPPIGLKICQIANEFQKLFAINYRQYNI
jgi:hypothetical protein